MGEQVKFRLKEPKTYRELMSFFDHPQLRIKLLPNILDELFEPIEEESCFNGMKPLAKQLKRLLKFSEEPV